jgi:acyl-coenzyme A thioesterase PaaI-like protein
LPAFGVLASLGDMAMQTALLGAYPGKRLITRTLNVRRIASQRCAALTVLAKALHADGAYAMSEASVVDETGKPVAFLSATFVPIDPPAGWRPLPWEAGLSVPTDEQLSQCAPLTAHERESVNSLMQLLGNSNATYRDFLGIAGRGESGQAQWLLQPHLLNRAGEAQGGAIFGAHGEAFQALLPRGAVAIEQTVTFFKSAKGDVLVEGDVVYAGRRFATRITRMRDNAGNLTSMSCTEYEIDPHRM